ncbi:MAG: ABC transporter substrate-binding protein [Candidatus Binatia bacterium]
MYALASLLLSSRTVVAALLVIGLSAPLALAKDGTILVITSQDSTPYQQVISGFRQTLQKQGDTTEMVEHSLQEAPADTWQAIQTAESAGVKLLFTIGSRATEVAQRETTEIPIVASMVLNIPDLRQTKNITGVVLDFPVTTQFEWIHRLLPEQKSIGVLYNPKENLETIQMARHVAQRLGLSLVALEVETPQALPSALESLTKEIDVLWGLTDEVVLSPQTAQPILLFSFRNRIPFIGLSAPWVKAGALYALDRDYTDVGNQSGEIALKILRGTSASTIAPAPPRKVLYSVNLKTAQHLRLRLADSVVTEAQQIFR